MTALQRLDGSSSRASSEPASASLDGVRTSPDGAPFPWLGHLLASEVDVTLLVPCYNEEDNVVATLETIAAAMAHVDCTYEIIVIDDCSVDQTSTRVKEYVAQHPEASIRLHRNSTNLGFSRNFFNGAFMARGRYYRLVCGDNVEPVETISTILGYIGQWDIVLPYHVAADGRSAARMFLSRLFTKLVNLLSGRRLHYYNGCGLFRTFDVMRWHVEATGFGFQAEFVTRLLDLGVSYVEVPVTTRERLTGKSKAITLRNWLSAAYTLLKIAMRSLRRKLFEVTRIDLE